MKINTDLVKGKKYSSAVKPNTLKHSQEYRVLATLRYLYPSKFDTMITGEAPDLQDSTSNTGIEVTVAVREDDMKVSRAFSELNQGKPKDIEKRKNIIESSGYSFVPLKDEKVAISTSGTADGEKYFFQQSILRKAKKLQQYRTNFKKIGLAILLPEIPTSYAENHLSEWISEMFDESANLFDFVYVISHRFCLYYDTQAKITEKRLLTQDESLLLATIGRMTAEGELTMTDTEWQ
jgi:hypothetical protein